MALLCVNKQNRKNQYKYCFFDEYYGLSSRGIDFLNFWNRKQGLGPGVLFLRVRHLPDRLGFAMAVSRVRGNRPRAMSGLGTMRKALQGNCGAKG
jgi:hypothetical protein